MIYKYGIIGGGPAGYTSALMLAKNGYSVILFEKEHLGGTCLNKGCIPTKAILHCSDIYNKIMTSQHIGIDVELKNFDYSKVILYKDNIVEKLRKSMELMFKNSKIEVINSEAKIKSQREIIANDKVYEVEKIINATGAKPKELSNLHFDDKFILSSDDVLKLDYLPKEVLIVGSGAIGIEWARIYSNFGVKVNIIELAEHLIPNADIEISKRIERIFKQKGINIYLKDSIKKIENKTVILNSENTVNPDFILVAAGRQPMKNIGGDILLGDICGDIQLAHYASTQAKGFVLDYCIDKSHIPSVIYGEPEIAWVGIKEQECDSSYQKVSIPLTALGKAWCDNCTNGFIKIITKDNKIKGCHIVSNEASSILQQVIIAMQNDITIENLKKICFPHPTFSEGLSECFAQIT